jgi:type IV pilus biogenesis protein PilP
MHSNTVVRYVSIMAIFSAMFALPQSRAMAGAATEIAETNERIQLLQAQLAELELKAKIAAKQAEVDRSFAPMGGPGTLPLPVVRAIDAYRGHWVATLAFPGGQSTVAGVHDILPNGYRVKSIAVNAVVIAKGKSVERLTFGVEPPSAPAAYSGGDMPLRMPVGQPIGSPLTVPGAAK